MNRFFFLVSETIQYTEYLHCVFTISPISRWPIVFRGMPTGFAELYIRTKASEN